MPVTRDGKRKLQRSDFPVNYSKGKRSANRRSIFTAFKHYGKDDKQENLLSAMKDFQMGSPWVPPTPAKLSLTTRHPICTEWQENHALQANWLQLQTLPQVNRIGQTEFDCGLTNVGNIRGTLIDSQVHRDDLCMYNFLNDEESGSNLSFGELLAKAHFAPNLHTEIEGSQYTLASESSSLNSTNITTGGSYTRSMPSIDLNLPCIMEDTTLGEFQFAPITPEKVTRNEIPVVKDVQPKEIQLERRQNNKQSELVVDWSYETMSTELEENHKPDKGDIGDVEWSKTPQQKPRRKKHRPKVIIEGQSKMSTPKSSVKSPSNPRETTKGKRKLATPAEREINGSRNDKRKYTSGVNKPAANTFEQDDRTEPETARQTRSSCRRSLNFDFDSQVRDDRNFRMQLQEQNINTKTDTLHDKLILLDELTSTRGKCKIVFSDSTHDKEANTVKVIKDSDAHLTPKRPSDSNCISRQDMGTTIVTEFRRSNSTETFRNSLQTYSATFQQNAYKHDYSPGTNLAISSVHTVIASETRAIASVDGCRNEQQNFKFLSTLSPSKGLEKQKSEAASVSNLGSLLEMCKQVLESPGPAATPPETIDNNERMTTKKRSKRTLNTNSTLKYIQSHHQLVTRSTGYPLARSWICRTPVDGIIEQCQRLDLNSESTQDAGREQRNELVAYRLNYQEQHALVPYQRNVALVPFDSSFYLSKRRRPRPKVDLDDETNRVWKLLLENINSEGIDGTDEGNEKWWEEERRVFRGRADSFIARMHLVQGDRRFSPWKGSVLDSVIGVFLTQNVSDHLSSSAFMSMVARFPFDPESDQGQSCEDIMSTIPNEPEVHGLDQDAAVGWNELLNQPACRKDYKIPDSDYNDIREIVNLLKSSGNSSVGTISKENPCGQLLGFPKDGPDVTPESAVNKSICYGWDEKDLDDTLSSQNSTICSLHSADPIITLTGETAEFCSLSTVLTEKLAGSKPNSIVCSSSNIKQTPVEQTVIHGDNNQGNEYESFDIIRLIESVSMVPLPDSQNQIEDLSDITYSNPAMQEKLCFRAQRQSDIPLKNDESSNIALAKELCEMEASGLSAESATQTTIQEFFAIGKTPKFCSQKPHSSNHSMDTYRKIAENPTGELEAQLQFEENNCKMQEVSNIPISPQTSTHITCSSNIDSSRTSEHREVDSNLKRPRKTAVKGKAKGGKVGKEKHNPVDWDRLRKQAQGGRKRERTANTVDSVDWDAVRCADVNEIAYTIRERGMNNMLAARIKDYLNRLVREHGSTDLEWLRDIPPDKAKEYLLSVRGLGLKSVECVRLLTLHHLAFPVDTNVGRIAVRLGWVPLQPLPESLQLHLLELYPVLESIQKFLWPRLCKLDQRTLYELHYQMITFGKVFCTKSKPNCNACPMRGECRHFASAFASARLALPAPEEKSTASAIESNTTHQNSWEIINSLRLPLPQDNQLEAHTEVSNSEPIIEVPSTPEPTVEMPATPEPEQIEVTEYDIEDNFEDSDDIPTIQLNMEEFTQNLQEIMQKQMEVQESDMSKALIALTPEAASIPMPKLKNVNRLRTEHQVYELPDSHPLLKCVDKRESDDPCSYLLAIWTPGETADSIQPPERHCSSRESGNLCTDETCFSCNSIREGESQTVRGTLLIPCRTAMRGSFPLNGTYFQVNEVFADHQSSLHPIIVPRDWLWNLPRRTVFFGTSIPTIFKGLTTEDIQYCFWRGFVCVRGFDRKTRAPRPLIARLHFPASKLTKVK